MTAISISDLSVAYNNNTVINGLNLDIKDGEFFTLLGPSGCGKTTLLRTIAGFITPAGGEIRFDEKNVTSLPTHRRQIGMCFQDYALFPNRTASANVAYGLKAQRVPKAKIPDIVNESLERVGMTGYGDRMPSDMSGGQRQRIALARALAVRPKLLLMDEPLSNLDAKLRVQIRESIGELQKEFGITTVFVTHDQEEALALSDRIALFNSGKIEQLGAPEQIYREPVSSYAADFIGAANIIPVTVEGSAGSDDQVHVNLGDEKIIGLRRYEGSTTSAVAIARPEALRVVEPTQDAPAGSTGVRGEVVNYQYLGHNQRYKVALANGQQVEIEEPPSRTAHLPGASVTVLFSIDQTLVMAS